MEKNYKSFINKFLSILFFSSYGILNEVFEKLIFHFLSENLSKFIIDFDIAFLFEVVT